MKTQQELNDEVDKLKEINLVHFAEYFMGYVVDEEKTMKENRNIENPKYIFMQNSSGERIIITKRYNNNRFEYIFSTIDNDLNKGNILNFVKYRDTKYSVPMVKKKVANMLSAIEKKIFIPGKSNITLKYSELQNHNPEKALNTLKDKYQEFPHLFDKAYLISRGLDEAILNLPILRGNIKNEVFQVRNKNGKITTEYVNTIFPIHGFNSFKDLNKRVLFGYVRRNNNLKVDAADSAKGAGIWLSNHDPSRKIDKFSLSENPIDSISYLQLHLKAENDNILLGATNGGPSISQMRIIQGILSEQKPREFILLYDNHVSGQFFNAKILSFISLPREMYSEPEYFDNNQMLVNSQIQIGRINNHQVQIVWQLHHDSKKNDIANEAFIEQHAPAFLEIRSYYENANRKLRGVNDENNTFKIETDFQHNYSKVLVTFQNTIDNWTCINKSILHIKFDNAECLKIEMPANKDFNEDLKFTKGLHFDTNEKERKLNKENDLNI